jgi:uncharacterized protein
MSAQDRYIPGVPCWIDSAQPDPEAAVAFYRELFGWELEDVMPPESPQRYFIARIRGGDVAAIASQSEPSAAAWNTYIWVADADETAAKVRAAGGSVLMEPADMEDAGRMAVFADPAGAVFSVWQPNRHRGAAVVNEHGSLNFNDLHTPDVAGAGAFYGAVFGWELLDVGGGSAWALPGYGDFLEARNPGMRENMAKMGAPERFEDVVASVRPASGGEPPHWGVTFGVEDADGIAARAAELGGRVIAGPFDAPWVRMAVISDPQGATFTASQFVPENRDATQRAGAATGA